MSTQEKNVAAQVNPPLPPLPTRTKRHRRPGSVNKKIFLVPLAVLCTVGFALWLFAPKTSGEEPARQREYPVETGDITVGVDAVGSITTEKTPQFADVEVQLERYTVKKGDMVSQGDVIAELSLMDTEKKLKEARDKLKTEQFNVNKAKTDKTNFVAESEKKLTDTRMASETAYNEKYTLLKEKVNLLGASLGQKHEMQKQHEVALADADVQKALRPDKLVALDKLIKVQTDEITRLEAAILAAAGDPVKIAELTEEKVRAEAARLDLNFEKETLEKTDYDALKAAAQALLDAVKTEIPAVQTEQNSANAALGAAQAQRQKEIDKENADLALLRSQNASQLAVHDNTIRLAQIECDTAQKKYNKLLALSKKPQITAEYGGTVLNLGVTPGADTGGATPVIEIGTAGEKTLTLLVDPVDIVDVNVGQEVSFYVDAYPDATFTGKVKSKSYLQTDAAKFTVTVTYSANDDYDLLEGMGASATLIVKQKKNVITLQNKAILLEDGKQYVLLKTAEGDGKDAKTNLEKREIKTGFSDGRVTEILSGLQAGDIVIVEERYEEP